MKNMFCDNLKAMRKQRGLSQETLALRMNVVRQTVSKWENGVSVPDATQLIELAEVLDTSVENLLGKALTEKNERNLDDLARELTMVNEQLAVRNHRTKNIIKACIVGLCALASVILVLILLSYAQIN